MEELEKQEFLGDLYAYYGSLLTPVQQSYFESYYYDDLSLGEIAQNNRVSRQAVYDNLRRCRKTLLNYEETLHLQTIQQKTGKKIEKVLQLLANKELTPAKQFLQQWLQELNQE